MANSNAWGDGSANNSIGWGQGANNTIGWGDIHADSWAGLTDIVGVQATSLLLDTYTGAAVAYSLRKLRTAYTGNAIRVRRSSDNTEQNIGFVGNNLDTASLLTFCGAGNGFVTTWYDQSGANRNIIQTSAILQPLIIDLGSLIYENGKLCFSYDEDFLTGAYQLTDDTNMMLCCVFKVVTANTSSNPRIGAFNSSSNSVNFQYGFNTANRYFIRKDGSTQATSTTYSMYNTQRLLTFGVSSNVNFININGVNDSLVSSTAPSINSSLGDGTHLIKGYTATNGYLSQGNFQEIVMWDTDQLANSLNIENNIKSYYAI